MAARRLRLAVLALVVSFLITAWTAAADTWRQVAFAGTPVYSLAASADGSVLYASTELGLQVSLDEGESWLYAGADLDRHGAPPVIALAIHPTNPAVAHAGTLRGSGAGIYETRDHGQSWQTVYESLEQEGALGISINPIDTQVIMACTAPPLGLPNRLVLSRASGPWEIMLESGSSLEEYSQVISDPHDRYGIYLTGTDRFLVSRNAGIAWVAGQGIRQPVMGTAVHPGIPNLIYAITLWGPVASTDGGLTWQPIEAPSLSPCMAYTRGSLAIAGPPEAPTMYLATRSLCPDQPAEVFALPLPAVPHEQGSAPLASSGQAWQGFTAPAGLTELRLAAAPGEAPRLYALTADGVWALDVTVEEATPLPVEAPVVTSDGIITAEGQGETTAGRAVATGAPRPGPARQPNAPSERWLVIPLAAGFGLAALAFAWQRRRG